MSENGQSSVDGDATRKMPSEATIETLSSANDTTLRQATAGRDPLMELPSNVIRDGDFCVLVFADGRQSITECIKKWRSKVAPLKINKRFYSTGNLVGLQYGTVLEVGKNGLFPLPQGEGLLPDHPVIRSGEESQEEQTNGEVTTVAAVELSTLKADNRHLKDDNKSQAMNMKQLLKLRENRHGSEIVQALIENSSTFDSKTDFSKAKYIARKQKKYQMRCRIVRCTPSTICEAMFLKDPRKMMNLREDTLGQILSYSNVTAGCHVLIMETCMGLVTGAFAQRMGGYGKIFTIYAAQQPNILEMLAKFNLSFSETHSVKYIHAGDVFGDDAISVDTSCLPDPERVDREELKWPCPLQDHTRAYLESITSEREIDEFLQKRSNRFARKLTRHSPTETQEMLLSRPCDSIVIVCRYDPTETLLKMLPFLAPSCPFVVFCEFLEPLVECFQEIQRQGLAINLKLSDTWTREYQMLPGRTHPNMNMSQNGGFLLVGIKLCPINGHNEIDEELLKEMRAKLGGRRGRKPKRNNTEKRGSSPNNTDVSRKAKRSRGSES
jgi:tRNA (adenine-N(1)-)-methyltransferase non-catalytic subunit